MDNKNIIIVLLVIIIVILSVVVGMLFMPSLNAQKDSIIDIDGNSTLNVGDDLVINLTDLNKTPIEKVVVDVVIVDKDGEVVVNESLMTNSKGSAKLNLDLEEGNYSVNATFAGNNNFTGNSTFKNITINKIVVEEPVATQQDTTSNSDKSRSSSADNRPAVDSGGITREEADYWGWKYTTDHGGHYIGSHDHWDEKAGVYHD